MNQLFILFIYLSRPSTNSSSSAGSSPSKPGDSSSAQQRQNGPPFQFQHVGDAGYDSYSLSSNDSYPLQQSLKQTLLQQIPETAQHQQQLMQNQPNRWRVPGPYPPAAGADECERLCLEADQLLERSRQQEELGDLESAFRFCQSAAQCSRAAMDAPYNNPQTLVFARMKHNTCVMRGRSLHRRLLQSRQAAAGYFDPSTGQQQPYQQHNGVAVLPSIDEPRHSRQNSRDSNRSSGSIGGRTQQTTTSAPPSSGTVGNIEIYATLPKKKGGRLAAEMKQMFSGESSSMERQSRSSSVQQQPYNSGSMGRRERAKSEERNKPSSKLPVSSTVHNSSSNSQSIEDDPSGSDASSRAGGNNKKQHRIRRRLLMGGLVKRKNRSLPDLRADDQDDEIDPEGMEEPEEVSPYAPTSSGRAPLAAEDASNPNLEKSKLMRKGFQSSLGRSVHQSPPGKVPPPPPVRKTSHLTAQTYTVQADVHHERTASDLSPRLPPLIAPSAIHDPLPPYPAVNQHVRQPSDEFPPPPPPQELQMLSSDADETDESGTAAPGSGLLAELQRKRKQILGSGSATAETNSLPLPPPPPVTQSETGSNRWLQELQATLQSKKMIRPPGSSAAQKQQRQEEEDKTKSVRKLASRFEQIRMSPSTIGGGGGGGVDVVDHQAVRPQQHPLYQSQPQPAHQQMPVQQTIIRASPTPIAPAPAVSTGPALPQGILNDGKKRLRHNKSVTFCDQVILVATAEDTEMDETYVPNPILQRVLRSAGFQQQPEHFQQQMQFNGTDEVDRPANRQTLPPYQKLPMNSQVFQQQQPQLRAVPASPMMGQRPGPPPSYAPPPQYPGRPQSTANNNNPNNSNAVPKSYQPEQNSSTNGRPPFHPQQTAGANWQQQQQAQLAPCSLCGKKQVPSNYQYCSDCQFYMQRFQPKA